MPVQNAECKIIEVDLSRVFLEYDPDDTVIYRIRFRGNDLETAEIAGATLTIKDDKLTIEQPASDATFTNDAGADVTIVAWSDADPSTRLMDTFRLRSYAARVRPLLKRQPPSFRLRAGETRTIDLNDYFQPSGIRRADDPCIAPNDRLFYTVDAGDAVGTIVDSAGNPDENGTFLRVTGAPTPGNTNVGIEATNTFNQTNTSSPPRPFVVRVESYNPAPVLTSPIADILANRNQEYRVNLDSHFTDDDDTLTYKVTSLSGSVATFRVDGSILIINSGDDVGVRGLRVVATDSNNQSVGDNFQIRVSNRPPVVQTDIPNQTLYVGQPRIEIDLRDRFTDPDGDDLTFTVARSPSDDVDTASATIAADKFTLDIDAGLDSGTGTFIVTATDTKGAERTDGFIVTVRTSDPPVLRQRLGDQVMIVGTSNTIDLASRFSDQDNITFTVKRDASDTGTVGTATIEPGATTMQLSAGLAEGTGVFLVRATDQSGQFIEDRFAIVAQQAPPTAPTVANNIMDFSLQLGMSRTIDLSNVFRDIEGAVYAVESTGTTVAHALNRSVLTVTAGDSTGVTTFVVTVTNRSGLEASDTFRVTAIPVDMTLRPPTIENAVENRELETGATIRFNLHNVFKNNKPGSTMTFAFARDVENITTATLNGAFLEVEATGNGPTVFTVTATNPDGNVQETFTITGLHHPQAIGMIEDLDVLASTTRQLNLLGLFSDTDDTLTYRVRRAASDTGNVAEATIDGAILTISGGTAGGTGTFIVSGVDQSGNEVDLPPFDVVVNAAAPMPTDAIRDVRKSITFNRNPSTIDLDDHFRDPGDVLMFSHEISGDAVALVAIGAGNVLTITPNGSLGTMTIKVIATDSGGFTGEQSFAYTVVRAPSLTSAIANQSLVPGRSRTIDLDNHFSHPASTITYSVSRTSGTVGTFSLSGSMLTLTAGSTSGTSALRVTARADGESLSEDFNLVTVANVRPNVVGSGIPDQAFGLSQTNTVDIRAYFADANAAAGDVLRFSLNAPTTGNITATIAGSVVTIVTGALQTQTNMTVRATDSAGLFIENTFAVRANIPPMVVGDGVPDLSIELSRTATLDLSSRFSDVGALVFTVSRTSGTAGTAEISGNNLVLKGGTSQGTSVYTVRATDQFGLFVESQFDLNVVPLRGAAIVSRRITGLNRENPTNNGARGWQLTGVTRGAMCAFGDTLWIASREVISIQPFLNSFTREFRRRYVRRAYTISTNTRDSAKDFGDSTALTQTFTWIRGMFTDGVTALTSFRVPTSSVGWSVQASRLPTASGDATLELSRVTDRTDSFGAEGVWSDGTTIWVVGYAGGSDDFPRDPKIYAYKASDGTRDSAKDFNTLVAAGNDNPKGIWSDGTTMWVADSSDNKIYAYNMATKMRDAAKDFNSVVSSPGAILMHNDVLYVLSTANRVDQVNAYSLGTSPILTVTT